MHNTLEDHTWYVHQSTSAHTKHFQTTRKPTGHYLLKAQRLLLLRSQYTCCCMPSATYGRNGVTPIFRSFHRTASSTTGSWSRWIIFRGYHIIFTMSPLFFIFVYISIFSASTALSNVILFFGLHNIHQHTHCKYNFYKHHYVADKHIIPKGKMHSNCRLLPDHVVCKITQ